MVAARRARLASVAVTFALLTGSAGVLAGAGSAQALDRPAPRGSAATTQRLALSAGLQVGTKHTQRPRSRVGGQLVPAANPYLSLVTDDRAVDWSYWRRRLGDQAEHRAARGTRGLVARRSAVPTPYAYDEQEPSGSRGRNDTQAGAEQLASLGTDRDYQGVDVRGRLSLPSVTGRALRTREDQGSIPKATGTDITTTHRGVVVRSTIGDGPHGRARDRHGDFDFFRVRVRAGEAVRASTAGSPLDTLLVLYDAHGRILDANDDAGDSTTTSALSYQVATQGTYYVMVAGYSDDGGVPANPFRSGSGSGAGEQGRYTLDLKVTPLDEDYYAVHLDSGDVLGGTLRGAARTATVHRLDGATMIGSTQDASAVYPSQSPLPGGGATFAYVAEQEGWYAVSATDGSGAYTLHLETYRPGSELASHGAVQTIFLDFDGERLNTNIVGGGGVSTLSPLSRFLPRWGLGAGDEDAVVDAVVASVKEDVDQTLREQGLNGRLSVNVLNSRDDDDPFGQPNVSRVVVGGTRSESGVDTIGIAQSIDPGNYAHEETALVLLDALAERSGPAYSLNTYLRSGSDRTGFVGRVLGDVASHEIGHMIGSFHTDERNASTNLMDAGGSRQSQFYGVGADRVGGTGDDTDTDFGTDRFNRDEGFTGLENTLNTSAWAFVPGA